MKKILAIMTVVTLFATMFCGISAFAAGIPTYTVSNVEAVDGVATVSISISGVDEALNLATFALTVGYDASQVTVTSVSDKKLYGGAAVCSPTITTNPYKFTFGDGVEALIGDGEIFTMTFAVDKAVKPGTVIPITVTPDFDNTFDMDFNQPEFVGVNGSITVPNDEPTAESIGLKTDESQILRLKDVKVNNVNSESYTVDTALGFVSCVNKDANATDLYTEINLEGWTGEPLKINAKNTTEIGDQIYFVAAVTSIREANLSKAFSAKAFATVDGKQVTDSNTVSATYNVQ